MMKKVVCAFLVALLACGIAFGSGLNGTFVKNIQGVTRFEMDSVFISTKLKGVSGTSLKIEAFDVPKGIEVIIEQSGTTVTLRVKKKSFLVIPLTKAHFVISVPSSADCELESASGSFELEAMDGSIMKIRTASGSVRCKGMGVPLDIQTASGSIGVSDSDTGKLLKSASGSVRLENSDGDAIIETVSGSVRIDHGEGAFKIDCTSGSVKLNNITGRLYVEATSGAVSGQGITLTGESKFSVVSGSLRLDLQNASSDFTVSASTVSGSLDIFGNHSNRGDLRTGSGKYSLSLKTVSGAVQVE